MHNVEIVKIKDVLQQMVRQSPFRHKLEAAAMSCAWRAIMPAAVYQRTERISFKKGQLFVKLSSAPLRHELQSNQNKVIQRLKEVSPNCNITEIVFV